MYRSRRLRRCFTPHLALGLGLHEQSPNKHADHKDGHRERDCEADLNDKRLNAVASAERINAWGMRKGILHTPYALDDIRDRIVKTGLEIQWERVSGNCYEVVARRAAGAGA